MGARARKGWAPYLPLTYRASVPLGPDWAAAAPASPWSTAVPMKPRRFIAFASIEIRVESESFTPGAGGRVADENEAAGAADATRGA